MPLSYPKAWSRALTPTGINLPPLAFLLIFVSVMISGAIAATGNILYSALFGGALIGLIIAGSPTCLFWIAIITSLVVAGVMRLYLPTFQYVRWIVPLAALGLAIHALLSQLAIRKRRPGRPTPAILWWALAFFCIALFSTLVNIPSAAQMLIGLKGYFQVWGILLALAYIPWSSALIDKLPRLLLGVALLQMPFALHQYLVLVPARMGANPGIVPADIVVGTFGADFEGGMSPLLSAFQFMVLAGLIALWHRHILPGIRVFVLSVMLLAPLLINQTKISLAYALIVFLILFRNDIITRPLRFLGVGVGFTVVLGVFFTAYTWNAHSDKVQNWADLITSTYEYNVGKEEIQTLGGKLSRWGALKFWMQRHDENNLGHMLLGHGVGMSRVSDRGEAMETMRSIFRIETLSARKIESIDPDIGIGRVAVTALLWDTGIIGLLFVFGLFWAAYRTALHLEHRYAQYPWHSALFRATQAAIAIFFVSLWQVHMFVFQVSYQTVIMLLLGYLVYWYRADSSSITAVAPPDFRLRSSARSI